MSASDFAELVLNCQLWAVSFPGRRVKRRRAVWIFCRTHDLYTSNFKTGRMPAARPQGYDRCDSVLAGILLILLINDPPFWACRRNWHTPDVRCFRRVQARRDFAQLRRQFHAERNR